METKLKLILERIHWSLLLKATFLGAVWLFLPNWLFLILSFYFYFIPTFHPWKLFPPFLVFIFLALNGPDNAGFAIILVLLFYTILGIKDLIFIDRRSAYDALTLVFIFLLQIWFFSNFGDAIGYKGLVYAFLLSAVLCLLYREALSYGNHEWHATSGRRDKIAFGLASLIISQIIIVVLFLPTHFIYQSALAFFLSAIILGLISAYLGGSVTRQRILTNFSVVFIFLILILGSIQWGL